MNRTVGVHIETPHSAASLYTLSHHPGGTHYRMSAIPGPEMFSNPVVLGIWGIFELF
jgi:hypothetical protein